MPLLALYEAPDGVLRTCHGIQGKNTTEREKPRKVLMACENERVYGRGSCGAAGKKKESPTYQPGGGFSLFLFEYMRLRGCFWVCTSIPSLYIRTYIIIKYTHMYNHVSIYDLSQSMQSIIYLYRLKRGSAWLPPVVTVNGSLFCLVILFLILRDPLCTYSAAFILRVCVLFLFGVSMFQFIKYFIEK